MSRTSEPYWTRRPGLCCCFCWEGGDETGRKYTESQSLAHCLAVPLAPPWRSFLCFLWKQNQGKPPKSKDSSLCLTLAIFGKERTNIPQKQGNREIKSKETPHKKTLGWHVCRTKLARNTFSELRNFSRKMLRNFLRNFWAFTLWVWKNPKGPKIEKIQSRPSEFPTKNRGLLGGSLEIFNLDWKFQSRRAILIFFNLWALREFCKNSRQISR